MNARSLLMLSVSAGLVIAGVVLEGTQQNPWNLFMSYMLPVAIIEVLGQRATLWAYAICTMVVGLASTAQLGRSAPGTPHRRGLFLCMLVLWEQQYRRS
jgi:hypothetical protein